MRGGCTRPASPAGGGQGSSAAASQVAREVAREGPLVESPLAPLPTTRAKPPGPAVCPALQGTTNLLRRALAAVGKQLETIPDPTQVKYHLPASSRFPQVRGPLGPLF